MELGLIRKTDSIKKDDRDRLVKFEKTLVDTLLAMEGKAQNLVSQALQNDLRQLLDITRSMTSMKERTSDVVDDDVLF
jgi:galactokinase/mevalonate kinase-like predicted kinase